MKLGDQVCSLELSQELKELNIEQDSYAYWVNDIRNDSNAKGFFITLWTNSKPNNMQHWSAFSSAEIGKRLPDLYRKDNEWYLLTINKLNGNWGVSYATVNSITLFNSVEDKILANAMAKMLVYLIENEFLEFEDEVTKNE